MCDSRPTLERLQFGADDDDDNPDETQESVRLHMAEELIASNEQLCNPLRCLTAFCSEMQSVTGKNDNLHLYVRRSEKRYSRKVQTKYCKQL